MRDYASEGRPEFPPDYLDDIRSDWPDMSHVRQVMVACESCGLVKPLNVAGHTVPVVLVDGDKSRFSWGKYGSISIRRWRRLEREQRRVTGSRCPNCGWCGFVAAGISGSTNE